MRLRNIPTARQELAESPYVIDESSISLNRGRWAEFFGNDHPIHIEIGMGKGQFLLELARRNPKINYIGIERYSSVLVHPARKLEAMVSEDHAGRPSAPGTQTEESVSGTQTEESVSGTLGDPGRPAVSVTQSGERLPLQNICLLRMDAEHLTEIFAPGEVERIYLNFSDPWPKDRHAKRRLPGRVFLRRYAQILIPGGQVEFKTDNRSLFDFALEEAAAAGWTVDACTFDLHHDSVMNTGNIMTEYEKKFSELGNPICKLIEHL